MLMGLRCGGMSDISSPSTRILPSVTFSKPASILRSVVLPQPEGPSNEKNSLL